MQHKNDISFSLVSSPSISLLSSSTFLLPSSPSLSSNMDTAEDFKTLVQQLGHLILAHHKRSRLPNSPTDPKPDLLIEMEETLIRRIHPFLPSRETELCFHHNAKTWTEATIQTLKEHYDRVRDHAIEIISALLVPDWDRAFLVAKRRIKRQNKNITQPSFDVTYSILNGIMSPSFPSRKGIPPQTLYATNLDNHKQMEPHSNPITSEIRREPQNTDQGDTPPEEQIPAAQEQSPNGTLTPDPNPFTLNEPGFSGNLTGADCESWEVENPPLKKFRGTSTESPPQEGEPITIESLQRPTSGPLPLYAPTPLFRTHNHQGDRNANWTLTPERSVLIMGDSNVGQLPRIVDSRIQVDCYPGARIGHATHILKHKTPTDTSVSIIILSFGINDREMTNPTLIEKPLRDLCKAAKDRFPNATIYMPLINCNRSISLKQQRNIAQLNAIIRSIVTFIPRLDNTVFNTLADGISWSPHTARKMLEHWRAFLD